MDNFYLCFCILLSVQPFLARTMYTYSATLNTICVWFPCHPERAQLGLWLLLYHPFGLQMGCDCHKILQNTTTVCVYAWLF